MEVTKINGFEICDEKVRELAYDLVRSNVIYDERIKAADNKAVAADKKADEAAEKAREADDAAFNYNSKMNDRVTEVERQLGELEERVNNAPVPDESGVATTVPWQNVTSKPSTFPPSVHTHTADEVGAKPADYVPAWNEVTGKPSAFPPESHNHTAAEVGAKPADYVPTWNEVTGKPSAFKPESHAHGWSEIEGKPSTFPPESHSHSAYATTEQLNTKMNESGWTANKYLGTDANGNVVVKDVSSYTLPTASATVKGGVKVGYGLVIDANGVLSLNIANASGVSF